jgi:hypothetical protein
MPTSTTAVAFKTLKKTLNDIVTDDTDGVEAKAVYKKFMTVGTMPDNWIEDFERGGPGFITEKSEGQALDVGQIYNGYTKRYTSRKYGLILELTEELEEDGKYNDKYVNFARTLKRAATKTVDVACANILNRAFNAGYVGADGVSLASASHTLPGGGTYSNTLSVAFSPSMAALQTVVQNVMLLPGHDGTTEGYMVEKVVHPVAQLGAWRTILNSTNAPGTANNDINVVHNQGYSQIAVPFWSSSTTNWGVITDAPNGLKLLWKRKPRSRTWIDENTEVIKHGISARWAEGWTDARCFYGSNA